MKISRAGELLGELNESTLKLSTKDAELARVFMAIVKTGMSTMTAGEGGSDKELNGIPITKESLPLLATTLNGIGYDCDY